MGFNEALRQLGKEIQADERFTKMMAAAAKNDEDEALQKLIGELNIIIMNYNQEAGKGEEADQEKIASLNEQYGGLYTQVMANANMQAYQEAQKEVEAMVEYIQKMIGMFLGGENPETCEVPAEEHEHGSDCSAGGCSSCSGCN